MPSVDLISTDHTPPFFVPPSDKHAIGDLNGMVAV
jgi:hypothetical protein